MEKPEELERELTRAVQLLSEAANWCGIISLGQALSPATRKVLVRAVMNDPTLTVALFTKDLPDVH